MDWFERLNARVNALAAAPGVTVDPRTVRPASAPIDDDLAGDIREDGGFVPDAGMRAFYGSVDSVDVAWFHESLVAHGSPLVGGRFDVGSIDSVVFSGYGEADLKHMGPRDATERAFLLEMRHIDTHHCAGDHWLALRPAPNDSPIFWWRSPSSAGIDIPLRGDFAALMDLMVRACGAVGWPLLAADLSGLRGERKQALLHEPGSEAAALRDRLDLLSDLPIVGTDARPLLERLDDLVMTSAEATTL